MPGLLELVFRDVKNHQGAFVVLAIRDSGPQTFLELCMNAVAAIKHRTEVTLDDKCIRIDAIGLSENRFCGKRVLPPVEKTNATFRSLLRRQPNLNIRFDLFEDFFFFVQSFFGIIVSRDLIL
jgi:hypothetical protein